jgi:hypothetical protein
MTWFDGIRQSVHLGGDEFWFICIALFFLTVGVFQIALLFIVRIQKSIYLKREQRIKFQFQKILNAIIIHETFSGNAPTSAFQFRMAELREIMDNKKFNKQILIHQILEIEKSLSGSSATALTTTYRELELYKVSMRKLNSLRWYKKAQGIRELGEMKYKQALPRIVKFLDARNQTLREETFMGVVRLSEDDPLFFLDSYHRELTPWMRINIHHYLARLESRKLPSFQKWFFHNNTSVALFSISMARYFRQTSCLPELVKLLNATDKKVIGLALETIGAMEAYQCADDVASMKDKVWEDDKLSTRFVRCLGKIGDPANDGKVISSFLAHPAYSVRFEAAGALRKLGASGEHEIRKFNEENENAIAGIIRHLEEPLLQ